MPALGGCQTGSIAEKKHVTASVHDTQSPGVGKSQSPVWLPWDRPRTARAIISKISKISKIARIATTIRMNAPPNDRESGSTRGRGRVRELASAPSEQTPKRQEPAPDTIFLLTRAEELPHLENPENTSPRNSSAPRAHSGWHFHSQRTSNRPRRKMKTWRM